MTNEEDKGNDRCMDIVGYEPWNNEDAPRQYLNPDEPFYLPYNLRCPNCGENFDRIIIRMDDKWFRCGNCKEYLERVLKDDQ